MAILLPYFYLLRGTPKGKAACGEFTARRLPQTHFQDA